MEMSVQLAGFNLSIDTIAGILHLDETEVKKYLEEKKEAVWSSSIGVSK